MMYVFYCCYVLQAIQFTGSKKCSYITGFPFYLFLKKLPTFTIELKSNKKKHFLPSFSSVVILSWLIKSTPCKKYIWVFGLLIGEDTGSPQDELILPMRWFAGELLSSGGSLYVPCLMSGSWQYNWATIRYKISDAYLGPPQASMIRSCRKYLIK